MTYNRDMSDWNIPDPKKVAAYLKAERAFCGGRRMRSRAAQ